MTILTRVLGRLQWLLHPPEVTNWVCIKAASHHWPIFHKKYNTGSSVPSNWILVTKDNNQIKKSIKIWLFQEQEEWLTCSTISRGNNYDNLPNSAFSVHRQKDWHVKLKRNLMLWTLKQVKNKFRQQSHNSISLSREIRNDRESQMNLN